MLVFAEFPVSTEKVDVTLSSVVPNFLNHWPPLPVFLSHLHLHFREKP